MQLKLRKSATKINLKYASQIMNELKMYNKIMLYHNKYHYKCHKLYSDT